MHYIPSGFQYTDDCPAVTPDHSCPATHYRTGRSDVASVVRAWRSADAPGRVDPTCRRAAAIDDMDHDQGHKSFDLFAAHIGGGEITG